MNKNLKYFKLSNAQKRIWYTQRINLNSPLHNIGGCLRILGEVNFAILEETIQRLIATNDEMRLTLMEKNGEPYQYFSLYKENNIDYFDFSNENSPEVKFKEWSASIFEKSFILLNSNLYYFAMYRISEKECGLLLKIHHIISDGWSFSILTDEICKIYESLYNHKELMNYKKSSYIKYIQSEEEYLKSDRFIRNKKFWNAKFRDLPESTLYKSSDELRAKREIFNVNKTISKNIKAFVEDNRISVNTFFMTIIGIYLSKSLQKDDIVLGNPVYNRMKREYRNIIGMFTSTMPVRLKINSDKSTKDLLDEVGKELRACFFNQMYPYNILIEDLGVQKKGCDSLFKLSVNYYNSTYSKYLAKSPTEVIEYFSGHQSYCMQLVIKEWMDDTFTFNFDYKVSEYTREEINYMYNHVMNLIEQVLDNPDINIKNINLYNQSEYIDKIYKFNSTINNYKKEKTVCEFFEEQVKETPDKIALIHKNKNLTYKELNNKMNQLALKLINNDVKRGHVVAIIATHSFELIIGILAVLKVGATYLPIDPNYPKERINYMLKDSSATLLLTNLDDWDNTDFCGGVLNLKSKTVENTGNIDKVNAMNDIAYIIYTSGSTGKPKGVMISNKNLVNYIMWASKMYIESKDEVFAFYSSISFDLTVTSIFAPLISGNSIAIYDNDGKDFVLYEMLRDNRVTIVKATPSHLTLLKDFDCSKSSIKRFIIGGENLKVSLAKRIYNNFNDGLEIINEYGPTEATVGCMIHKYNVNEDNGVSVPIGKPADNVQIYLLDKYLNLVPTGIIGEIYISGDGVAKGYINRHELTNERFIDNPFVKGNKMYKTGDLAKYLDNGDIEYIGRSDNQVKIRGHRIELGEMEECLISHKKISNAVVMVRDNHNKSQKLLYAYLKGESKLDDKELKKWMEKYVPQYMIPNKFMYIDEFPLTSNGKVDFELLPRKEEKYKKSIAYRNEKERLLVEVMEEVLDQEGIGIYDNYYEIGGDSIKAIQISSKLKNLGLEVSVKNILSSDIVGEIAVNINVNRESAVDQGLCTGGIEKTPIMQWFFSHGFKQVNHYNQSVLLETNKVHDIEKVEQAVHKLIEHHDMLRLNYNRETNEMYYQNSYIDEVKKNILYFDLSTISKEAQYCEISRLGYNIKSKLDLERDILFKVCAFKLEEERQLLLFIAHHLLVDGVSWRILIEDFSTVLQQLESQQEIVLPNKTHSYGTWAKKLQEYSKKEFKVETLYWRQIEEKNWKFPTDFAYGLDSILDTSTVEVIMSKDITLELIKNAREIYGIDISEVLIIALGLAIKNKTDQHDLVIEVERHGREEIDEKLDISRTVGWFTSMFPVHLCIEDKGLDENIKILKEQIRNIPNKGFDYSVIKYLKQHLSKTNKKAVRLNYLGDFDNILEGINYKLCNIETGADIGLKNNLTSVLDINSMIVDKELKIGITYSKNMFKEETIQAFAYDYVEKLKDILDCCSKKEDKELTPSDFDEVEISQDDLDSLFG